MISALTRRASDTLHRNNNLSPTKTEIRNREENISVHRKHRSQECPIFAVEITMDFFFNRPLPIAHYGGFWHILLSTHKFNIYVIQNFNSVSFKFIIDCINVVYNNIHFATLFLSSQFLGFQYEVADNHSYSALRRSLLCTPNFRLK